ncbi:uncharacterized protein LOC107813976 [Nicotiana tabacum]|uniref:Uncharacterized protein LOC107813976 n=1 Tax=Nicotiana tabacum TaxID=4097 RepID=A0A1S4C164_TOBAC|nr:PREDICTED: uncharacterized protein LOC107813976 [Nicotiana tabacum]
MSTFDTAITDIEANGSGDNANLRRHHRRQRRRRRIRRPSMAGSSETTTDGSFRFSDSDSDQSWHSPLGSVAGRSYRFEECGSSMRTEGNLVNCEQSKRSGACGLVADEEIDLESGELELKVHNKEEKSCRICHLSLLKCGGIGDDDQLLEPSGGMAIELGCSCKGDLAAAHKHCAETWFKIKGNTICEICGATALNVTGGQANEANNATITTMGVSNAPVVLSETRRFWHGRRVINFLLACMIFAFVVSWLFHFKIFP